MSAMVWKKSLAILSSVEMRARTEVVTPGPRLLWRAVLVYSSGRSVSVMFWGEKLEELSYHAMCG